MTQKKDDNLPFANLDISLENQKDHKDLTIGNTTKSKLHKALDEGDISHAEKFYDAGK